MAATVLAFSVQIGSGGFTVAHRVADRLGFRYYDWEITNEAAQRAGVSPTDVIAAERVPSFVERMMRRLGAASTVGVETSPVFAEPTPQQLSSAMLSFTSDDYRDVIEHVVLELAETGNCVIVGHASQYTLRNKPGVLRVLLYGSTTHRAERVAAEQGISLEEARNHVKQSDRDRGELMKRIYRFDWISADGYDIALNTDRLDEERLVDLILEAAEGIR